MSDKGEEELLRYYQQELSYLRKMGTGFAEQYPSVAGRLNLGEQECADPHVERLLESFAFLTGRIQYNIDREFPAIPSALLDILYPHLQSQVPSMAIAQFEVDPAQGSKLVAGFPIERGTPLFARTGEGPVCQFRTCYPLVLWPLQVVDAKLAEAGPQGRLLAIRLQALPGITLDKVELLDSLRFYVRGDPALVSLLCEMLFHQASEVHILPAVGTRLPGHVPILGTDSRLPASSLAPVGFGADDAVLPYPPHAHPAYRLLQEYFAFPKKFAFFQVNNLDLKTYAPATQGTPPPTAFDIYVTFAGDQLQSRRGAIERAEALVDEETFCLGCTPIINLFPQTTEPLRLDYRQPEYTLAPDAHRWRTTEIYSIEQVTAVSEQGTTTKTLAPLFGLDNAAERKNQKAFWYARRSQANPHLPGTEMVLSFVDLAFNPRLPDVQVVYAQTLCTNRDLAEHLPPGARLQVEQSVPVRMITCLDKPTPEIMLARDDTALWRLVSQLSLNHLSLTAVDQFSIDEKFRPELDGKRVSPELRAAFSSYGVRLSPHLLVVAQGDGGPNWTGAWAIKDQDTGRTFSVVEEANGLAVSGDQRSLAALRAILQLYTVPGDVTARRQLLGIVDMVCRRVTRRVGADPWGGFARGIEIALTFDDNYYEGQSSFLLATVLNHFFSLYVTANMFTQLIARKKDVKGDWKRWGPMAGGQPIL